jgi:rSAM/selenodomain-associated transferase 2
MKLSVIIPVLNEREQLPHIIAALQSQRSNPEIIVVDGGSTDGTREWLRAQTGLIVMEAERGRGVQQNAGAKVASGEVLLFLHGDCVLPNDALRLIEQALHLPQTQGGAFLVRFAEPTTVSLRLIAHGINARTLVTKTATGDQAIFVRRELFTHLGGFAAWPLFEDVRLVTRLKQRGRFVIVKSPVTISPRRYVAHGPWRTTFLMYALRLGYWLGVPPHRLYRWFADVRPHLPGAVNRKKPETP